MLLTDILDSFFERLADSYNTFWAGLVKCFPMFEVLGSSLDGCEISETDEWLGVFFFPFSSITIEFDLLSTNLF